MTRDEALAAAERAKQEAWYAQDQAQRAQRAAAEQAARDRQIQEERFRQDQADRERYYREQDRAREEYYSRSRDNDSYYGGASTSSSGSSYSGGGYSGGPVNMDSVLPGFNRFNDSADEYERALQEKIRASRSGDPRAIARAEKEVQRAKKKYMRDSAGFKVRNSGINWKTIVGIIVVIFLLYSCAS